jgi:coproporphyrinogen III oxidase-like Fe-S oxidoreductase
MLMDFIPSTWTRTIRNIQFAKLGFEAKHNGSYWTDEKYLGLRPFGTFL